MIVERGGVLGIGEEQPTRPLRGQALPIRAFGEMSGLPPVVTELRTSRFGSFVPILLQKSVDG